MSAESGISTFRDADGLWEKYPVMQVCSADGFAADPALVHRFYNDRRSQLDEVQPCEGHRAIARRLQIVVAHVFAAHAHNAVLRVVKTGNHLHKRRFTATRSAQNADGFSAFYM